MKLKFKIRKYQFLLLLVTMLPILSFVSCSQDEIVVNQNKGNEDITDNNTIITIYLKNISSPGSRAGETSSWGGKFEDGFDEQALASEGHYALFFKLEDNNIDNKFVKQLPLDKSLLSKQDENEDNKELVFRYPLQKVDDEIYKKYKEGKEGDEQNENTLLGYCLILLNAKDAIGKLGNLDGMSYEQVINKLLWEEKQNPHKIGFSYYNETVDKEEVDVPYFVMTNSAYIVDEKVQIATPFTRGAIQQIDSENPTYNWKKAITVYVERLNSKFDVTFIEHPDDYIYLPKEVDENDKLIDKDNTVKLFKEIDEDNIPVYYEDIYSYKVKITGWAMNAYETSTYLFKNLTKNSGSYFTNWSQWSDPTNFRTYWSEDPHYSVKDYPWQYRKAVDKELQYYSKENADNHLKNYSYNEVVGADNFDGVVYTPENTYDNATLTDAMFDNRRDLLVGTHLLVTAELLTNFDGGEHVNKTVYRDRFGNFYKNKRDCFIALVTNFNNTLNSQGYMEFKGYSWGNTFSKKNQTIKTNGKWQLYIDDDKLDKDYIVDHFNEDMNQLDSKGIEMIIDATIKGGDGKFIFWNDRLSIRNEAGKNVELVHVYDGKYGRDLYTKDDGTFEETILGEAEAEDLKNVLFEWMGAVDHFNEGKMYYAVPITHYAATDEKNNVFGAVRNHWYRFEIIAITSIGTSVDKPEDPIVPNFVSTSDQINFKVNILKWHEQETTVDHPFFN